MAKFDEMFKARPLRPLEQIPRHPSSRMKALEVHGTVHGSDDAPRPIPRRHFATLSIVEQLGQYRDAEWPMWVVELRTDNSSGVISDFSHAQVWIAPNEAAFNAANHGDPAPPDQELEGAGWRRAGGAELPIPR